ncbi:MAG TPA: hypothetical protein VKZ54_01855 [Membranihabitans sp.]|nr:hypothetical protein [Membranihabitans sp.]
MAKFSKFQLKRLEEIFKELEYNIRYGKGQFNSGYCLIRENKVIVVNKFFDTSGRVEVLLEILDKVPNENDPPLSKKSLDYLQSLYQKLVETNE